MSTERTSEHEAMMDRLLEHVGDLDPELAAHVETCDECRALADTLREVDGGVRAVVAPPMPDDLMARTLARIAEQTVEESAERAQPSPPSLFGLFGGLFAGLLGGLWAIVKLVAIPFSTPRARRWTLAAMAPVAVAGLALSVTMTLSSGNDVALRSLEPDAREEQASRPEFWSSEGQTPPIPEPSIDEPRGQLDALGYIDQPSDDGRFGWDDGDGIADRRWDYRTGLGGRDEHGGTFTTDLPEVINGIDDDLGGDDGTRGERPNGARTTVTTRLPTGSSQDGEQNAAADRAQNIRSDEQSGEQNRNENGDALARITDTTLLPGVISGLAFQPPHGYWANTYVPGDPAVRLLRRRLEGTSLALAERAAPTDLALDAPRDGALAVSVRADRASIEGRSRVIVAVGLRGAEVRARRTTLETAVVIDARQPLDAASRERVRALLTALSRGREGADRISVIVAGPRGGVLVPAGELRYGELSVALDHLEQGATAMTLESAVRTAVESVGRESGPLASGLVLLATPGLDDAAARSIEAYAHAGALAGVSTSTIGLNEAVDADALGRVALAGQGRRYSLARTADADSAIEREVHASSQVVARAARLRIRLAPGASLVGVLGSHRLDEQQADRVRDAERTIDRTLATDLGIASDRGEDEDGIQIVIPAFYAGDQHVVLLDLVVDGPGAIADVSVRWKDLVRQGNGAASERLTLGQGSTRRGPRERGVVVAYLAHELSVALRGAARDLEAGQPDAARARIEAAEQRLAAADLASDVALCAAYRGAIERGEMSADALRYASVRRVHGEPLPLEIERATARVRSPVMEPGR
jgi:hypothetical protein